MRYGVWGGGECVVWTQAVREKGGMSEVWGVGIGECVVWTQAVRQKGGMSEVWSVGRW